MSGEKEHMTEGARSKRQRFVIWHRFKKNKQAVVGLVVLCIFILIAVFADRIAPYWYDDQTQQGTDASLREFIFKY